LASHALPSTRLAAVLFDADLRSTFSLPRQCVCTCHQGMCSFSLRLGRMAGAFFQLFSRVSEVRVTIEELVPDVVHALVNESVATGVLPSLTSLFLKGGLSQIPICDGSCGAVRCHARACWSQHILARLGSVLWSCRILGPCLQYVSAIISLLTQKVSFSPFFQLF